MEFTYPALAQFISNRRAKKLKKRAKFPQRRYVELCTTAASLRASIESVRGPTRASTLPRHQQQQQASAAERQQHQQQQASNDAEGETEDVSISAAVAAAASAALAEHSSGGGGAGAAGASEASGPPTRWLVCLDEVSGDKYFYNTLTGETQAHTPPELVPEFE